MPKLVGVCFDISFFFISTDFPWKHELSREFLFLIKKKKNQLSKDYNYNTGDVWRTCGELENSRMKQPWLVCGVPVKCSENMAHWKQMNRAISRKWGADIKRERQKVYLVYKGRKFMYTCTMQLRIQKYKEEGSSISEARDVSWWQGIRGRKEFNYRWVFSVKERENWCPTNWV